MLWVDNAVVSVIENVESRVCQYYRCTNYNHRDCYVLHIFHGLYWDQNARDNAYPTHVNHMFCCVDQETSIWETDLWHNIFSLPGARQLYYVAHNTLCLPTFLYLTFFMFSMINTYQMNHANMVVFIMENIKKVK